MKENVMVTLQLFGVLRQLAHQDKLMIEIPSGSELSDVREKLREKLMELTTQHDKITILTHCLFANEKQILTEQTIIQDSIELAVLPPFSGG